MEARVSVVNNDICLLLILLRRVAVISAAIEIKANLESRRKNLSASTKAIYKIEN
tara:strand:+ start:554 stop:718 length:165 start_codon:yes stop_codon:yes gene_type:complete